MIETHNDAKVAQTITNSSDQTTLSRSWWQRPTFTIAIAVLGLLAVLIFINIKIMAYEAHLAHGDTVLLELAPVDPRGFMQGDYMTLRYALEREIVDAQSSNRDQASDGYVIVALDKHNVGHVVRLADSYESNTLATNEKAIHYRLRHGSVKLATNAFFFQEGHGAAFEAAEYGQFRVNDKGEPLLTDLINGKFEVINAKDLDKEKFNN